MPVSPAFLRLFSDKSPKLLVKFWYASNERPMTVKVNHRLGTTPNGNGRTYLKMLAQYAGSREFVSFYKKHDGAMFCTTQHSSFDEEKPLIEFKSAAEIDPFSQQYKARGDRAWTMNLNKSKRLYRGKHPWIAFAEVGSGPACLTMFLEGENAGMIFYAAPQPTFNILRPIAKSFNHLLERIGQDPPAFLRLVRAMVCLRGKDGENYGLVPTEYVPDVRSRPKLRGVVKKSKTKNRAGR